MIAGHCVDIDGYYWHLPGECPGPPVNCDGRCCTPDPPPVPPAPPATP